MLQDRGYMVPESDLKIDFEKFNNQIPLDSEYANLNILVNRPTETDAKIIVYFISPKEGNETLSSRVIIKLFEQMKEEGISRSILVTPVKISKPASKALETIIVKSSKKVILETFLESELIVN